MKLYFTYGQSENQPYQGGWSIVEGESYEQCVAIFRAVHPDKSPGTINCAFIYTEEEFKKTVMYEHNSNMGASIQEIIGLVITKAKGAKC